MGFRLRLPQIALAIVVTGAGAYWHYSPYLALKSMRTAAEQKDAESFNAHDPSIDCPRKRNAILRDGVLL